MAYPEYVPTRVVTVGGASVLESAALLRPIVSVKASRSLIWMDTGYRMESVESPDAAEAGAEVSIELPRCDVQGWKDAKTNMVLDVSAEGAYSHTYTMRLSFNSVEGRAVAGPYTIGPFVVPAGEGPIDLDSLIPVGTSSGTLVNVPDQWSAAVAAAEAAASDAADALTDLDPTVADLIDTPGSAIETAVSAKIDPSATSTLADVAGKIVNGVNDISILLIGDSVTAAGSGWSSMVAADLAERFPTHTVTKRYWTDGTPGSWAAATTVATGSSPRTIAVHVAAVAGKTWEYHLDASRRDLMLGVAADAVFISLGHNEDNGGGGMNVGNARIERSKIIGGIGEIQLTAGPGAYDAPGQTYVGEPAIILMSTNPLASATSASEFRADLYRRTARLLGLGFLDICKAFHDDGRTIHTTLVADGVHPTIAGYRIIADQVQEAFRQAVAAKPQPTFAPWTTKTALNLLPDGGLTNLDGSNKPPAWQLVNATATIDTSDYETGTKSLVFKANGTASTPYVRVPLPAVVKGRTITLAIRAKTQTGKWSNNGVGSIGFYNGVTNPSSPAWAQHDQWVWRIFTYRFAASATATDVRIYVGNNTSPATDELKIDRAICCLGAIPADLNTTPA
jgi:lysophospholipase L1-like esterase